MKDYRIRKLTALVSAFVAATGSMFGDIHYVSPGGGNAAPYITWATAATSIQPAVDAASNGDTVLVADGTYPLSQQIKIIKPIKMKSVNGASATIVDGGNVTRCIYIGKASAIIDGFTITRGFSPQDGGGIYMNTPFRTNKVLNCVVTSNKAFNSFGGGIYIKDSTCEIRNSVVSFNSAWREGGGVYWNSSDGAMVSVVVSANLAVDGGAGVTLFKSTPVMRACHFSLNYTANSGGNGGGLSCLAGSDATLEDCRFEGNVAWGGFDWLAGGGLFCDLSNPTLLGCVFTGNIAKVGGGFAGIDSSPILQSCQFFDNRAYDSFFEGLGGGVFFQNSGNPQLLDCLFEYNHADDSGGGIAYLQMGTSGGELQRGMLRHNTTGFGEGGGIACLDSAPFIANSAIVSNRTDIDGVNNDLYAWGSGVYAQQNSNFAPSIRNATISFNARGNQLPYLANDLWCQKLGVGSPNSTVVRNSIIYGAIILVNSQDGSPALDIDYSDNVGGPNGFNAPAWVLYGSANIDKDPEFVAEGWRIESGTPCVDAGDAALVAPGETDLDNEPRVMGSIVEMGADEVE